MKYFNILFIFYILFKKISNSLLPEKSDLSFNSFYTEIFYERIHISNKKFTNTEFIIGKGSSVLGTDWIYWDFLIIEMNC